MTISLFPIFTVVLDFLDIVVIAYLCLSFHDDVLDYRQMLSNYDIISQYIEFHE